MGDGASPTGTRSHGVTPPPWPGLPSGTSGPVLGPALSGQAAVARIGAGPSGGGGF